MIDVNGLSLGAMYEAIRATGLVRRVLELARDEDLGPSGIAGDVTSVACGSGSSVMVADVAVREACVIAGLAVIPDLIAVFGGGMSWHAHGEDGMDVEAGTVIGTIEGAGASVVAIERTMLNLVGRLSGIATHARAMRGAMDAGAPGHRAVVLDTRKTTPGLRVLEKYAVRCGGCECHRMGLFDAVLVKDNHLAGVGLDGLGEFVRGVSSRARAMGGVRFVEVEVDTVAQLERVLALEAGVVDIVLLDNMDVGVMREAVAMRDRSGSRVLLEASGGVTKDRIASIAATGVDRISVGALTHSARVVDIGLDARTF